MDHNTVDYLRSAVRLGASDLHLTNGAAPSVRVNGEIIQLEADVLTPEITYKLVMSLLSDSQRAVLEEELELDFAVHVDGVGRFRGNAHYNRGALEAVYRHIIEDIPDLSTLGHEPIVESICDYKSGLVLVTGITGSGKSSTMAAMIKRISETRRDMIISIEDPIEFVYKHNSSLVKQREVGHDTHSFKSALRTVLRQDPDVILISELRDLETIQSALTAAETGHLVISTLHTIDAPKTLDRLIDAFPASQQNQVIAQLSNCLRAVISQRLLKREDGTGRVLSEEVMIMNRSIRNCIREEKFEQIEGLIEIGRGEGMFTIDAHLLHLVKQGVISIKTAYREARDDTLLNAYVKKLKEEKKR